MFRCGAATAANDGCAAVAGQGGIMGHQLWRAVIMDMAVVIFWDARIAFCNDGRLRARGGKSQDRPQQIRRSHATIGPKGERFVRNFVQQFHHI